MNESFSSVAATADPVKRFEAARAAAAAVTAQYRLIEVEAANEVVAEHGGNVSAAARELAMTPTGLAKLRRSADPVARPARTRRSQGQPALHFSTQDAAEDALRDWHLRRQDVEDESEQLLLGALASGVDPLTVVELTQVPLELLRRIRPAGNIAVSALTSPGGGDGEVLEQFARQLLTHSRALSERATSGPEHSAARIWRLAANSVATNAAPEVLYPEPTVRAADFESADGYVDAIRAAAETATEPDIPEPDSVALVSGPDAWLALTHTRIARDAERCRLAAAAEERAANDERAAHEHAMAGAFQAVADAITQLRTTGTLPALTTPGGQA
ncbi:hypothetical protein [Streptomyces sp. NPDC059819]|uniref:hypothetical protein n=1 Tax=Streptomyces sp. NPDC059819 TaxID=3346963 RepID=UPI003656B5DF